MSLLANSNAIETSGYNIQRSLRFRSSASAYLNRTPASSANRQISTFSAWVKRGILSSGFPEVFSAAPNGSTYKDALYFTNTDTLCVLINGGVSYQLITSQVFRDPSAWYHIVLSIDTTQATASNRIKLYVNGSQVTAFSTANYPTQNYNPNFNSAIVHNIGRSTDANDYFDGYLAEVNFIDGQALTPSSFGQTDPVTGVWTPKKYTGTYGTNGFYLPFSDNTSATTLAYDKSGNGNNWTPNNISTTAGATYDSMTDVPTLTSATAANFATINLLKNPVGTVSDGNLKCSGTPAAVYASTIGITSGKWYWEGSYSAIGSTAVAFALRDDTSTYEIAYYNNGNKRIDGTNTAYGATWTTNDIVGIAVDYDGGSVTFYKNGASQGAISYSFNGRLYFCTNLVSSPFGADTFVMNFGQRPFSYTPPTGFKALNTFNLPDPTIKKPNQYMDATTYTGNGGTQTVTNAAGFQPDLVWVKNRSVALNNELSDSVRGATKELNSNNTGAETTNPNGITAFNSNGFTVGPDNNYNQNTTSLVGWQWQAGKGTTSSNTNGSITSTVSVNPTAGFSVVTYTGTGAAGTVGHGLGISPKFIIVKDRSGANPWPTYHDSLGAQYYTLLNASDMSYNNLANYWGSTNPSSTTFGLNSYGGNNTSGHGYVAYCFSEITGYSKFGSYTGNSSADGVFCYTGFRPKWILIKKSAGGTNADWHLHDTSRDTYNSSNSILLPDSSGAEAVNAAFAIDVLSNGFKLRTADASTNGPSFSYIYAAFAENPLKYSLAR